MKSFVLTLVLALAFSGLFTHCKKQEKTAVSPAPVFSPLPKGKLLKKVALTSLPGQSYALYLPPAYDSTKTWPVVYFFDAHARGSLPLKRYRTLADSFGSIFIGANNLKNGLNLLELNRRTNGLLQETAQRFAIDSSQKYIMGFSGGARSAVVAALQRPDIQGVIGCAAGFPQWNRPLKHRFDYVIVAGKGDFNYLELVQLEEDLILHGLPVWYIEFEGKHQWPDSLITRKALSVLWLSAMRKGRIPRDEQIIKQFVALEKAAIKQWQNPFKPLSLEKEYRLAIGALQGLTDVTRWKAALKKLQTTTAYLNAKAAWKKEEHEETKLQKEIQRALIRVDVPWFRRAYRHWHGVKPTDQNYWQAQRLLGYMSLMAYLYAEHALKANDTKAARAYLQIYALTDANNADYYYLSAWFELLQKNIARAQALAEKALKIGLDDPEKMFANPMFSVLKLH